MRNFETEVKVGLFVVVGLALLMFGILMMGNSGSIFSRSMKFYIHVTDAAGVVEGAKVVLNGLSVGTIKEVTFDSTARDIRIELSVLSDFRDLVREGTTAEISTQGVLGDKYVQLKTEDVNASLLPVSSSIPVKSSQDFSKLVSRSDSLMHSMNGVAQSLEKLLMAFQQNNRSIQFFEGMAKTAANLSVTTERINSELHDLKLKSAVHHLNEILEKVNRGKGTIGALVNDPGLYDQAKSLVGGANRNRIMRNLVRKTVQDGMTAEEDSSQRVPNSEPAPKK